MLAQELTAKARLAVEYLREKGGSLTSEAKKPLPKYIRSGLNDLCEKGLCRWYLEDNGNIRYELE